MQNTSNLYKSIIGGDHWFETRLLIDKELSFGQSETIGTFGESDLFEISTHIEMFHDSPTIGSAVAGEITVKMIKPSIDIPKMAKLRPQVRVCNATQQSEWIPQGFYYIDTRETTHNMDGLDVLTIHGYDAMLKTEQMFRSHNITGDSTDRQMVQEIALQLGVSVDSRTWAVMGKLYTIPLPTGYTFREVLGYIASMYAGCFVMTDQGKLRLVSITEIPAETSYLVTNSGAAITFGGNRILV